MALDDAISQGKLKRGEKALFCVSGGGLNMAAMIFKY
jgi:3-oxoacyl-[acyl-carrier-protein] synthase III